MQEKMLGIRVHRVPTLATEGNAQIYYDLKAEEEPDEPHAMFFTSDKIHETLTNQQFPAGRKVGYYLVYKQAQPAEYKRIHKPEETDGVPVIKIQDAQPFAKFTDRPRQTGISSMAEKAILQDLVEQGLGHYSIEHNISLDQDFQQAVKPIRIAQLCKRLGITGGETKLETYRKVKEEMEKHTVASYLDVLKKYIESHKTD